MKHTKKLISIPESEYQALLGLLDPMKKEKVLTDQKIAETFQRPGLSALERGARYQLLAKKRRMLNKKLDNKPSIEALLEQSRAAVLPPTAGVAPAVQPQQQIQEAQQQEVQQELPPEELPAEEVVPVAGPRTRTETVEKYHNLFEANKLQRLKVRVDGFKEYFGINERGEILANKDKNGTRIKDSDYEEVLDYLTGNIELPEDQIRAITVLVPRLLQDDGINKLISAEKKKEMSGAGRRRRKFVVDLKPIKNKRTRGLTRFKPLLWSKLPV